MRAAAQSCALVSDCGRSVVVKKDLADLKDSTLLVRSGPRNKIRRRDFELPFFKVSPRLRAQKRTI